jgi:hypothetical protein
MSRIIYLGNSSPIYYKSHKFGEESIQTQDQPKLDTVTTIHISPDSTMKQALEEIQEIWTGHSHDENPSYIGYNTDAHTIAIVLSSMFNNIEIKEVL